MTTWIQTARACVVVFVASFAQACLFFYEPPETFDCGRIDDQAVTCANNAECADKLSNAWQCQDGMCIKDCMQGYLCGADGYCKAIESCGDDDVRCGSRCVPKALFADDKSIDLIEMCCGDCAEGEACCPSLDANGDIASGSFTCKDLQNDKYSCGVCGVVCSGLGNKCLASTCRPSGYCDRAEDCEESNPICCDNRCYDKSNDDRHCGSCGHDCTQSGEYCYQAECIVGTANDCCGSDCDNCIAAGKVCRTDQTAEPSCGNCVVGSETRCPSGYSCIPGDFSQAEGLCTPVSAEAGTAFSECTMSSVESVCAEDLACVPLRDSNYYCLPLCVLNIDCEEGQTCTKDSGQTVGPCMPLPPCAVTDPFNSAILVENTINSSCATEPVCVPAGSLANGEDCAAGFCGVGSVCVAGNLNTTCHSACTTTIECSGYSECRSPIDCMGVGFCD